MSRKSSPTGQREVDRHIVRSMRRFAIQIHRAGYATSPTYLHNLIAPMRTYNLHRFDAAVPRM